MRKWEKEFETHEMIHVEFQDNPNMTREPANPKKSIKEFYVWKIGMHLFCKLKTDCKERVRVGKFPAHQIKNKSSIHIKKNTYVVKSHSLF